MEETINSQAHYCYSHDQLMKTAFEMELRSIKVNEKDYSMERELIKSYLKDRINQITERWRT